MADDLQGWTTLATAVGEGQLYLEPGVAKNCAQKCDELLARMNALRDSAVRLAKIDGLGTLPSGVALAGKFERKASGGEYSLDRAIADHIVVVAQMRDLFTKIGAQYQAAEDANQQSLTNVDAGF
ncbi:hypothetical protein AB4Z09_19850 [Rhodococcus sp. TAF43]|uniref:hypothetical protein n=1 Tax=Rhodococcus sp. TAF43 TaxID=3237483 RepID=UPI003F9736F6